MPTSRRFFLFLLVCCVTRARADLKTTSAFERVEREKELVELKAKYTIRNDGANDVNLAGQALMLRFPGYVRVRNDDDPEQSTVTRALPRDWIVECFWSYVEGRYNGTNVCPSIDFVVSSNAVEVRFVNTLILCPGCTLRGDSSYTSFVLKHRAYFPIFDNGFEMLESMGVHDFFDAPPPPPPTRRTRVCFPREVDFSFKVSSYPSRFDESRRVSTASEDAVVPLGTAGFDAFLRVFLDVRNRQSIDFDMSSVVIDVPFDWKISPSESSGKIQQTPDDFFARCHGQGTTLCDVTYVLKESSGFQIRFTPGFALCPGCSLRGKGPQGAAYELYSPFLFPLDIESVRGAAAFCDAQLL
jgi:hypothetical protein